MPRAGTAYHIDDDWRARTEQRLKGLGWSRADLAKAAKCPRSLVTELLNGKRNHTTFLPEIHRALGWPPPQSPLPEKDASELSYIWARLDQAGRDAVIERGRAELDRLLRRTSGQKRSA